MSNAPVGSSLRRRTRVGLIERDEVVRAGLGSILSGAAEAFLLLEPRGEDRLDILLLDPSQLSHPSRATVQELRAACRAARVVAMGWQTDEMDIRALGALGFDSFLFKGMSASALVGALTRIAHSACRGSRDAPPARVLSSSRAAGRRVLPLLEAAPVMQAVSSAEPPVAHGLTERQLESLRLAASGLSNAEIAGRMFVSVNTVKSYLRCAYRALGIHSRQQAVVWGYEHGMMVDRKDLADAARPEVP